MNRRLLLAAVVVSGGTYGCATPADQAAKDYQSEEGVYLTGSRLPQRTSGATPVAKTSKEGWEDATRGHKQINPQGH